MRRRVTDFSDVFLKTNKKPPNQTKPKQKSLINCKRVDTPAFLKSQNPVSVVGSCFPLKEDLLEGRKNYFFLPQSYLIVSGIWILPFNNYLVSNHNVQQ